MVVSRRGVGGLSLNSSLVSFSLHFLFPSLFQSVLPHQALASVCTLKSYQGWWKKKENKSSPGLFLILVFRLRAAPLFAPLWFGMRASARLFNTSYKREREREKEREIPSNSSTTRLSLTAGVRVLAPWFLLTLLFCVYAHYIGNLCTMTLAAMSKRILKITFFQKRYKSSKNL